MPSLSSLRSNSRLTQTMQVVIIVAMLLIVWRIYDLGDRVDEESAKNATAESIIAQTCGVASFDELRRRGLVEECRLAQEGKLGDAIPDDAASPGADPSDVNPDVIDDGDVDEGDVRPAPLPQGPTNAQVSVAVDDWFDANPLTAQPGYVSSLRRTVAVYLTENPPKDGRPPTEAEIRAAVQASLMANPPEDGTDGRGVVNTSLDGCDVVFAYSDGGADRVGPICGPAGKDAAPPSAADIRAAVDAYCAANGCTGPPGVVNVVDNCPPTEVGQQITDVNLTPPGDDRTMVLSCEYGTIIGGGNGGGPGNGGGG